MAEKFTNYNRNFLLNQKEERLLIRLFYVELFQ